MRELTADRDEERGTPLSPEGAATLISLLETDMLVLHRSRALRRLRELRDSNEFASLPDDLQTRISEIVGARENVHAGAPPSAATSDVGAPATSTQPAVEPDAPLSPGQPAARNRSSLIDAALRALRRSS